MASDQLPQTVQGGAPGQCQNDWTQHRRSSAYGERVTTCMICAFQLSVLNGELTRMWYRLIGQAAAACVPGAQRFHNRESRPYGYRGKSDADGDVVNAVSRTGLTGNENQLASLSVGYESLGKEENS